MADPEAQLRQRYLHLKNTAIVTIEFTDMPDLSYNFMAVLEPYMEEVNFTEALKMLCRRNIYGLSLFRGGLSYDLSADRPTIRRRNFVYLLQQFIEHDNEKRKLFITARGGTLTAGLFYQLCDIFLPRTRDHTSRNMPVIPLSNSSLRSRLQTRAATAVATVEFKNPLCNFPVLLERDFDMVNFLQGLQHLNSMQIRRVHLYKGSISHTLPGRDWTLLSRTEFASIIQEHVDDMGQPNGKLFITAGGSKLSTNTSEHIRRFISLVAQGLVLWLLLPPFDAFFASFILALWLWRPRILRLFFG